MPSTLDWKNCDDPRDVIHIIVQALVEGKLVVLPSETSYLLVASGLQAEAVVKLTSHAATQKSRAVPDILLRSSQEALDYVPDLSRVATRMVNRGWPGPLSLELSALSVDSVAKCLSREAYPLLVVEEAYLPMRVVSHEAIAKVMRLIPGPLVSVPLSSADGSPICVGQDAVAAAAELAALIVDDGQTHFGGLPTRVRIDGSSCQVTQPGVVDQEKLNRLSELFILFVCTGNTCRSPMAEALLREILAQRFPKLAQRTPKPYFIASAGLSAFPGGSASSEALTVMQKRGLNISDHQSRAVTEHALRHADLVLTMTNSHRQAIVERLPQVAEKVRLVSGPAQTDVSDPFGGSEAAYAACADQMTQYLNDWQSRIEESWFPIWQFD